MKSCSICGIYGNVQMHHVFQGAFRKASENRGFVVPLCFNCHLGPEGVHHNKKNRIALRQICQREYEKTHTREDFIAEFGRNYLED